MKAAYLLIAALLAIALPADAASNWKNLKADETGTPDRAWKGGNGLFEIQGVLGGATVKLQRKLAPVGDYKDVTPITTRDGAADCDLTIDAEFCWFVAPGDSQIHPVVVGGDGTTDITVMVSGADQASTAPDALTTTDNAVQFGNAAGDGLDEDPTGFFYDGTLNIASTLTSGNWTDFTGSAATASLLISRSGVFNLTARPTQVGLILDVRRGVEERFVFDPSVRKLMLDMRGNSGLSEFVINGQIGDAGALKFQAQSVDEMELQYDDSDKSFHISTPGSAGTDAITIDSAGEIGIGTPIPIGTLDVVSSDPVAKISISSTNAAAVGNTPTLALRAQTTVSERSTGQIEANFSDITDATRTSVLLVKTATDGAFATGLSIDRIVSHDANIGPAPPATCRQGAIWIDTDQTDDSQCVTTNDNSLCCCISADTWVVCGNV